MKNLTLISFLTFNIIGYSQSTNLDSLGKEFDFKNGIYFEREIPDNFNPSIYTIDNQVYTLNKTFYFDYYIINLNDTLKLKARVEEPKINEVIIPKLICSLVSSSYNEDDLLNTISISVVDGFDDTQSVIDYKYYNNLTSEFNYYASSGLIENKMNIWLHPFRDGYFNILQHSPFPFIQHPLVIGNKWTWKLIYENNDESNYNYEIVKKEVISTKIGNIDCWVVNSSCENNLGQTELTSYFSEKYGFVKMDYLNIDKNRLVIELKKVE